MKLIKRREMRWFIISDIHSPFHNVRLVEKVCACIRAEQPYGIIINGDFLDLFSIASHNADSLGLLKNIDLEYEYRVGNDLLNKIDDALPKGAKKKYIYGNHEDRYIRELMRGDRAKYAGALVSPEEGLGLRERGYKVFTNWKQDSIQLGSHLEVTHGVFTPVHAAKKHLDEFQGSVIVGHTHRFQSFVSGKRGAWNFGFLGDIESRGFYYMSRAQRSKWSNSFGTVDIDSKGYHYVQPIHIFNESFICSGVKY